MKNLLVITGASCSGKTTVELKIREELGVRHLRTTTTRLPRTTDAKGYYQHVSKSTFQKHLKSGDFAEYNCYGSSMYGVLKSSLDDIISSNERNWSVVLDVNGANAISMYCKLHNLPIKLCCIVLGVPTQILMRRLFSRVLSEYKSDMLTQREAVDTLNFRNSEIVGFDHFQCYETLNKRNEDGIIKYAQISLLDNASAESIDNIIYIATKFFEE